ncbi:hypothetical protein JL721_8055 [Aureococcus anophagefferens]|nr:hypothetical protein JL721_8055 [Aureococcus anophagefferens]
MGSRTDGLGGRMGSQRRLTDGLEDGAYRAAAALRGAADDAADALAHERDRAAAVLAAAADVARSSLPGFGGDSPPFGDARGGARPLGTELLPADTLLRAEKLAAMVSGSGEAPRMDPRHSADGARLLARTIAREVSYDRAVRREYCNLGIFVVYVVTLLTMITLQRGVASGSGRLQALAARRTWLGLGQGSTRERHSQRQRLRSRRFSARLSLGVTADESRVTNELVNVTGVLAHVRRNVETIFGRSTCGNGVCEAPDEHPFWRRRRRHFGGCTFDCGAIATVEVGVTFFDAHKYRSAAQLVRGFTPLQWGAVDERNQLLRTPAAGWNVCSRTDALAGHFEKVCVFDGDVFIDGLPYRTLELDVDDAAHFAAKKTASLYAGDWELVYAFANFSWFEDGDYVCYDRDYWKGFDAATMRHDGADAAGRDEFDGAYAAYRGFEAVAAWHWSGDCAVHDLLLVPGAGFLGWAADVLEVWVSNATATDGQAALRDGRAHLAYVFELDEGPCAERKVFLCADKRYTFGFRPAGDGARRDTTLLNYELYFEGELRLRGAGPAAVEAEAGDCGALATDGDGRCVDHNASFCAYGSDVDAPAFCDPAREAYDASLAYARDPYGPKALDRPSAAPTAAPTAGGGDAYVASDPIAACDFSDGLCAGWTGDGLDVATGTFFGARGPNRNGADSKAPGDAFAAVNGAATPNATATLESPEFSLNGSAYVSFLYSAYGDIARTVEAFYFDGGGWTRCFRAEWDQGAPWRTAFAALPATATKVRVALAASAWGNVVALDDVVVGRAFAAAVSANATNADAPRFPGGSVARLPLGVTTCDFGRWGDGFCDVDLHSLGCAYDGGDCCGDDNFGCAAPWYAADPADAWRYAVKTTVPVMSGCSAALAEVRAAVMSAGIQIDEAAVAAVAEVQIQATVPFALYFAALDRLRLEVAGDPNTVPNATAFYGADVEHLVPSLACPECAEPSFTRRIPFTVTDEAALTTSNNGGGWNPEGNVMFPHLEDGEFRVRTFAEPAIVQHGLVVQQTRIEMATCPRRVSPSHAMRDPLENRCADYGAGDSDRSPFGNDPTFNVDSSTAGRLRDTGLPYGFFYDGGAGDDRVDDFPVVFDTIINASRAEELLATLIEGAYVDAATGSVTLRLLTYNGETDAYTKLRTVFTREPSGLFSAAHDVSVLRVDYYANTPEHVFRGVVEGLFVVALLALLGRELVEVRAAYAATGSVRAYAADASNAIDLGGYVVQILMIPAWVRANIVCFNLDIELKYDTHDADAVGRISRSLAATADLLDFFTDLDRVELLFGDYDSVCTLAIIALSIQLLKNVQFHPTFGMISRTIRAVAGILWFWLCMLVLMLLLYTFIGTLLLGQTLPGFADIPSTGVTLLAAMSGLYEYDRIDVGFYEQIYFWTWMLLAFFVMYNVLLAIIVEEHQKTATQLKRDPTPFMCRALCGRADAGDVLLSAEDLGAVLASLVGDAGAPLPAAAARALDPAGRAAPPSPPRAAWTRRGDERWKAFAGEPSARAPRGGRRPRLERAPQTSASNDAHRNHKAFAAAYNFLRFHDDRSRRALAAAARRDDDGESSLPAACGAAAPLELHFDTPGDGDGFSDDGSHHHGDDPPQAREATSSGPGA